MNPSLPDGLRIEQVHRYLEKRDEDFDVLEQALESKDIEQIRSVTHRIRGSAALYALPELGLAAGSILDILDDESWSEIEDKIDKLRLILDHAKNRFVEN
jgi:HPt (histidine-containing phosphotransfer) domain-containing protein